MTRAISEPKWHDYILIQAKRSQECSFELILLFDSNLMIGICQVHGAEYPSFSQTVQHVSYPWYWVLVQACVLIQHPEIHTHP